MATIAEAFQIALQYHQTGKLQQAEQIYRQILLVVPDHLDALHLLGVVAHQVGQHETAVQYIQRALSLDASHAAFHNNLGEAYRALGRLSEAEVCYREALGLDPEFVEAHLNLGLVHFGQQKLDAAQACFEKVLQLQPGNARAYNNLGNIWRARGRPAEATTCYRQALRLWPDFPEAHNNLGNIFFEEGKLSEAADCLRRALRHRPDLVEAHNNLGNILRLQGSLDDARASIESALRLRPDWARAHHDLGLVLQDQGQLDEAASRYRRALALRPNFAEAHTNLGNIMKEQLRLEEAEACYRRSLQIKPDLAEAANNLIGIFLDQGRLPEALACLDEALALAAHDGLRIRAALALPVIFDSVEDMERHRVRVDKNITKLLGEELAVAEPVKAIGVTIFQLAYLGDNVRDLHSRLAHLYLKVTPALASVAPPILPQAEACGYRTAVAPHPQEPPILPQAEACDYRTGGTHQERPIRIGFISKYFYNHPIGRFYSGVIRNLSRERFHVVLLDFPGNDDPLAREIRHSAATVVTLSFKLDLARRQIAAERLDVLFYTDIGMDLFTYCLAFSRLAPVQCVGSGHPVTTGIPMIDYFLSDVDLEPEGAEEHYTERLVRLAQFPFYFYPPRRPAMSRARGAFGLNAKAHWYVCAQTLFKIHPELDLILGEILRADPLGQVILFQSVLPHWTELLRARLRRSIPEEADRVQFLPRQSLEDFLQFVGHADVLLDTIHFSGGTSSFEALTTGTPIVTLPGAFMRGRVTYACYRKMGVLDCVASSREDYVRIAVRLANDPEWREEVKSRILAANHVLYENPAGVRALERFFIEATKAHGPHLGGFE